MEIKEQVTKKLFSLQDLKYQKFHSSLCPGINNIIGVRTPILKSLAKDLLKNYSFKYLYENIDTKYYEEIMLKGYLISYSKENINIKKEYIDKYIPLINNWAICDCFCNSLKLKNKEDIKEIFSKYIKSNKEFEIRFGIVIIINYYIEKDTLEEIFKIFNDINNDSYYVQMALAWAISICLIKYYDDTINYLKNCNLDDFTYNKAIQKACESYRVDKDKKEKLKKMKRHINE